MARLWSSGAELNSVTNGIEFDTKLGSGTTSIDSTVKRSGTYSMKIAASAQNGGGERFQYSSALVEGALYVRTYFRIEVSSDVDNIGILRAIGTGGNVEVRLQADDTLILYNTEDSAQIGSASSALALNTWYRIELKVDSTAKAATLVEARIDGTAFASGTVNLADGNNTVDFLGNHNVGPNSHTGTYYHDDMAINDGTGSFQNSWPGEESIIHLRPSAVGDADEWDLTTSYENIDEVTPDDATTVIASLTSGQIHDVNIDDTPVALGHGDRINVVHIGVRFNESVGTDPDPTFVLRVKASAGDTVEETSDITASTTSWSTNAVAAPRNYVLTLYNLPGTDNQPWTKYALDSAQIGVRLTNTPVGLAQVSALWMVVCYTPDTKKKPHNSIRNISVGNGMSRNDYAS